MLSLKNKGLKRLFVKCILREKIVKVHRLTQNVNLRFDPRTDKKVGVKCLTRLTYK